MKKIKIFRKQKGWSQRELANMIGAGQSRIAMWESDKSKPRVDMLPKLAELFDCTIDDLYDKEAENDKH